MGYGKRLHLRYDVFGDVGGHPGILEVSCRYQKSADFTRKGGLVKQGPGEQAEWGALHRRLLDKLARCLSPLR